MGLTSFNYLGESLLRTTTAESILPERTSIHHSIIMVKLTAVADALDGWPSTTVSADGDLLESTWIQCAGQGFLQLQKLAALGGDLEKLDNHMNSADSDDDEGGDGSSGEEDTSPTIDLFSLSEQQLADLNYYQVLHLPYKPNLSADDVKKAYRKASLIYHPDKSGRGEEDAVFLKVKAAFETLSTQKQAYDSTEMPFDDSVPEETVGDFFVEYGPVFERNLHFDARLLSDSNGSSNGSGAAAAKKGGGGKNRRKSRNTVQQQQQQGPPSLGDDSTPIDQVHVFYDYWTHFTSWRDFSLQAARELETQEHLENAESRYEKRWYQKEIDRLAKKLKQQEQARITTLVERAMSADPRLIQERKRLIQEKEMKKKQREQDAHDKKQKEAEARMVEEQRIQEEKEQRTQEKHQREKEKKMLRKTKQAFRKVVADALEALLEPEHTLEHLVDDICAALNRDQLLTLISRLELLQSDPSQVVQAVRKRASNLDKEDEENEPPVSNGASASSSVKESDSVEPAVVPIPAAEPSKNNINAKTPFTKEELSTLAKGMKKFPPGGSNRWDQIASYINNVCRPSIPRTKEECIEVFNQNKTSKAPQPPATSAPVVAAAPVPAAKLVVSESEEDVWTEDQDKLLQEGLANNPATMDKNERWTNIANCVPGKTKKQCVARFKAIREAIMNKK